MNKIRWNEELYNRLRELSKTFPHNVIHHILSEELGFEVSYDQVRNALQKAGIRKKTQVERGGESPLTLEGDWVIAGDLHCPYVDWELADMLISQASTTNITNLIICGDVFDQPTLSQYPVVHPPPSPHEEEIAARALFKALNEQFQRIVILTGNHDLRVFKALQGAVTDAPVIALMLARIAAKPSTTWSSFGYCLINTPKGVWRVTHPRNYSRIPLATARSLASKYQQNVITLHEHMTAMGIDTTGLRVVANVGCLADPGKLPYVIYTDTTAPHMTQSFAILLDGRIKLFDKAGLFW